MDQVSYKLELPAHSKVHPVFHVSRLRKRLRGMERPVDDSVLVEYVEPPILPHEPERVLDYHMLRTRHQVWKQALIKCKDRPEEGSTWENISVLRKCLPTCVLEDKNDSSWKTMIEKDSFHEDMSYIFGYRSLTVRTMILRKLNPSINNEVSEFRENY